MAACLCIFKFGATADLLKRIVFDAHETPTRRLRALAHMYAGAYYAVLLGERRIRHIHVHHGYFSAAVAMAAARFLRTSYSVTLHGSDLLMNAAYLDEKLANCKFCVTISNFNRDYLLRKYKNVNPNKVFVQYLGIEVPIPEQDVGCRLSSQELLPFRLLSVGRLHKVKDHAFLLRCCKCLKDDGFDFTCTLAGDGPERRAIETLALKLDLSENVKLAGHLKREELDGHYQNCDLVVLTSRSEGIPLVLMEAMVREKLVLAPAITGIPELVHDGKNGFLYTPGSADEFVKRVKMIADRGAELNPVRRAARQHVSEHYNQRKNVAAFCDLLTAQL